MGLFASPSPSPSATSCGLAASQFASAHAERRSRRWLPASTRSPPPECRSRTRTIVRQRFPHDLMQIKDAVPLASIVGHKEWVCLRADRSERRQMMEHENAKREPDRRRLSVVNIVLAGFPGIAGFFPIPKTRAQLLGA